MQDILGSFFWKMRLLFCLCRVRKAWRFLPALQKSIGFRKKTFFSPILSLGRIKSDFMIKMAFRKDFLIARLMHSNFLSNFLRSYIYYCLFDFCHKNHMLVHLTIKQPLNLKRGFLGIFGSNFNVNMTGRSHL